MRAFGWIALAVVAGGIAGFAYHIATWRKPASEPAGPAFPYRVTASDPIREAIDKNVLRQPFWAFYAATEYAKGKEIVFSGESKRLTLGGGSGGSFDRGFSHVELTVRLPDGQPFAVADTGETPMRVPMRGGESPQDTAFRFAEEDAVDAVMPFVCGRLLRLAGDAKQTQALIAWAESKGSEEPARMALRGLGSAAASFAPRAREWLKKALEDRDHPEDAIVTLLAVSEPEGATALQAFDDTPGRKSYLVNQHLELQAAETSVYILHPLASNAQVPWAKSLSPAGAASVQAFALAYPGLVGACAATLARFDASDATATAALRDLRELPGVSAAAIDEAVAEVRR